MIDAAFFMEGLRMRVAEFHGFASVRVRTYDNEWLVRDVVKTYEGAVSLNVYVDRTGLSPIISSTSSVHDFQAGMPTGYVSKTIPFEQIIGVDVVPANHEKTMFN
jgi:hypothetical protein